jgi:GTP cyclohydrolase I
MKTMSDQVETTKAAVLTDIQNSPDDRNITIDRVGVRRVKHPMRVMDRANGVQHTVGQFTLTVDLPSHYKGTHMSRFVEVLSEFGGEFGVDSLGVIVERLLERLDAKNAHLDVDFTFFVSKPAPVTKKPGMMGYECGFRATGGDKTDLEILVTIPVTTLCPCSKEISAYGAHNQRGYVSVAIRTKAHVWIEEIIEMVEQRASAPLYPLLKRPDEKFVTELAYDHPRFVEDMVREVSLAFDADDRIISYKIEVENHESIHDHNAYAMIERKK